MSYHPWHVYTIPVQVFQEDISIPPSQRTSLREDSVAFEIAVFEGALTDTWIHTLLFLPTMSYSIRSRQTVKKITIFQANSS